MRIMCGAPKSGLGPGPELGDFEYLRYFIFKVNKLI